MKIRDFFNWENVHEVDVTQRPRMVRCPKDVVHPLLYGERSERNVSEMGWATLSVSVRS